MSSSSILRLVLTSKWALPQSSVWYSYQSELCFNPQSGTHIKVSPVSIPSLVLTSKLALLQSSIWYSHQSEPCFNPQSGTHIKVSPVSILSLVLTSKWALFQSSVWYSHQSELGFNPQSGSLYILLAVLAVCHWSLGQSAILIASYHFYPYSLSLL